MPSAVTLSGTLGIGKFPGTGKSGIGTPGTGKFPGKLGIGTLGTGTGKFPGTAGKLTLEGRTEFGTMRASATLESMIMDENVRSRRGTMIEKLLQPIVGATKRLHLS